MAVSGVTIDHDKVLLVRRSPLNPEVWAPPGGKVERHEHLVQALERETHEEIGVTLHPLRLLAQIELHMTDRSYALFSFLCDVVNEPSALAPSSDALDLRWWRFEDTLHAPLAPGVFTVLRQLTQ
ncbi:NUDIX domain-containing protein [Ferrimicrobium sp.]|uniref:NUDIX domain-containing protein n=1 Tax=Ferrimicrobium sp. TaxID=2926050 RepID=UPI00262BC09C|nr:NUDIX domain-containing protein [Ferrimicrobium sp.]